MTTVLLLTAMLGAGTTGAGAPASQAAAPAPGSPVSTAAAPSAPDNYTYDPMGRRDPFVSLLRGGAEERGPRAGGPVVEGLGGLTTDEVSVRGVVAAGSGYLAMVQGPDNKTFIVRANDKLLDGTVKAVTAQGLVILQEVNDPLSLVKQKEVRKMLRGLEEGK
jgi:type IV pilus assembly protein PilP